MATRNYTVSGSFALFSGRSTFKQVALEAESPQSAVASACSAWGQVPDLITVEARTDRTFSLDYDHSDETVELPQLKVGGSI
jgi:hypothetical protein